MLQELNLDLKTAISVSPRQVLPKHRRDGDPLLDLANRALLNGIENGKAASVRRREAARARQQIQKPI